MIEPRHIRDSIERALHAIALSTAKPGSRGGIRVSGGTNEPPMPISEGIMWGKRLLHDRTMSWASMIGEEQQIVVNADFDDVSMLCWLHKQAHHLAEHDEAQQFLDEITEAVKLIESPYNPRIAKRFKGIHGGGELYIKEGQQLVELEDGRVEPIESIKAWNRDEVRLYEGTAKEVSEMVWEFFDEYVDPRRISTTHRNDNDPRSKVTQPLTALRMDGKNHIYRVQDVLKRFIEGN